MVGGLVTAYVTKKVFAVEPTGNWTPAQVVTVSVPMAELAPNMPINPDALRETQFGLTALRDDTLISPSQIVGRIPRRPIAPGSAIREAHLYPIGEGPEPVASPEPIVTRPTMPIVVPITVEPVPVQKVIEPTPPIAATRPAQPQPISVEPITEPEQFVATTVKPANEFTTVVFRGQRRSYNTFDLQ